MIFFLLNAHVLKDVEKLTQAFSIIQDKYYKEISNQELIETTIKSLFSKLDPHSYYLSKKDLNLLQQKTSHKNYTLGINIKINNDNYLEVVSVDQESPSFKKLQEGDILLRINKEAASLEWIEFLLEHKKGPFTLDFLRNKKVESLIIEKKVLKEPFKYTYTQDKLVISIKVFRKDTSSDLLKTLQQYPQAKEIIIDLRNNPGGILEEAIECASYFIQEGQALQLIGKNDQILEMHYLKKYTFKTTQPVKILINEATASAAEIFSALFQDYKRGFVLGQKSYGKGSVQGLFSLGEDAIKLTIALYKTPKRYVQHQGVLPDKTLPPNFTLKNLIENEI